MLSLFYYLLILHSISCNIWKLIYSDLYFILRLNVSFTCFNTFVELFGHVIKYRSKLYSILTLKRYKQKNKYLFLVTFFFKCKIKKNNFKVYTSSCIGILLNIPNFWNISEISLAVDRLHEYNILVHIQTSPIILLCTEKYKNQKNTIL